MAATLKVDTIQNASSATANITLDTAGNATVGNTLAMGSSFLRNKIINGNLSIWQRGTTFTNIAASTYSADRWTTIGSVNQTITQSTDVPSVEYLYSLKTVPASNGTPSADEVVRQYIEAQNLYDFGGKSVTLSAWVKCSKTTVKMRVASQNTTGGTDVSQNITVTAGTWTKLTYTYTSFSGVTAWTGAANAAGAFVDIGFQDTTALTTSDYLYITGVQLEVGSVATPFERRQYGQELALCQRYYQQYSGNQKMIGHGYMGSATAMYRWGFPLSIEMRTAPTLAFSGDVRVWGGSGPTTASATSTVGASYTQTNFVDADINCAGVTTTAGLVGKLILNTSTAAVTLSAEL